MPAISAVLPSPESAPLASEAISRLPPARLQHAQSAGESGEDQEHEHQERPSENAKDPPNGPAAPRLGNGSLSTPVRC